MSTQELRVTGGAAPAVLTAQELAFAQARAAGATLTDAALAAGWSKATAASKGSRLAKNDKILAEISRLKAIAVAKAEEDTGITRARVIAEHACSGLFDPSDLFDESGNPLPVHKLPERARRAIASIDIEERFELGEGNGQVEGDTPLVKVRSTKLRFNNKTASLAEISKLQGHYPDKKLELPGKRGVAVLMWEDE